MKNKYGELASNTVIFGCATLGAKLIMFFLLPLYTNRLSTSEYGIVELIITGINLLTPILTLSITDAILRFGLDKKYDHSQVLKVSVRFLLCASAVMVLCSPLINLYRPLRGYSWIFTITLIVFMFRSAFTFYLKSIDKNVMFAVDTILYTLLLAGFNILFLIVFDLGVTGYMLSLVLASASSIVFCSIVGRIPSALGKTTFDGQLLKQMLIYSTPLILNAISWWITNSSDKYMLEYFCSESEVGLYSAAAKIPALLSAVNSLFSQAWTLSSVKEYDSTADRGFFSNIFKMFAITMIMSCSLLILIVKPFMSVYVGPEFREAWKYVPMLLVAALFGSLSSFFGSVYVATKKNIRCTTSTVICGITNIILNYILIPRYGIMGASIATAVSYMVIGIYRMLDCQKTFYFKINYFKNGICALIVIFEALLVTFSPLRYLFAILAILLNVTIYFNDILFFTSSIIHRIKRRNIAS